MWYGGEALRVDEGGTAFEESIVFPIHIFFGGRYILQGSGKMLLRLIAHVVGGTERLGLHDSSNFFSRFEGNGESKERQGKW